MLRILMVFLTLSMLNPSKAASQLHPLKTDTVGRNFLFKPLPQNFYKESLGFFCKKELQIQRLIKLPLYFRVGSKDYTDYLEKKPNTINKVF